MKEKRNYTKEFKVQACELVLKDGLKAKSVAERMGMHLQKCLTFGVHIRLCRTAR